MEWCIQTQNYREEDTADQGNTFLTGNGYMGIRGTMEEHTKAQLPALNLAGIYDRHGEGWREPLNAPNALYTVLSLDGKCYTLPNDEPVLHTQELDFRNGVHKRRTVWQTPKGQIVVTAERFASMDNVHLICLKYSVCADFSGGIALISGIDGDVWDINGPHYSEMIFFQTDDVLCCEAISGEQGHHVVVCEAIQTDFLATKCVSAGKRSILRELSFTADKREATLYKFIAVCTSRDGEHPQELAARCVSSVESYESARAAHCKKWAALWERTGIEIDGDDEAMRALNYSIYHLHCIAPRHAQNLSIAARGLSGQTYKGAVFWDTELFLFDFYLHTEPKVARALLQYRIESLQGAQKKAAAYHRRGAFYAWESQENGFDACSDYNVTDVFTGRPVRTYFRDKQVHISAAIAFALMKYIDYTGDVSVLADGGAEVVIECARFYRSLLVKRVDGDRYEIRDVIGPDEYHERIDNNAYTNCMAVLTFRVALHAVGQLKQFSLQAYEKLENRLYFEAELCDFEEAAERLFVPKPDPVNGLIEQFDGYFALEDTTPTELLTRLLHPKEYWGGANGVAAHTQVIKQADVVAMLALLSDLYPKEVLKANWDYYEPRTEHGSSLSACMHALLACAFGDAQRAYSYFMKTATVDLIGKAKQWAGLVYIGGTHPAAAGGAWMTAVLGFGGLRMEQEQVVLKPCLPPHWKRLRFSFEWRGTLYSAEVTHEGFKIQ